MTHEPRDKDDIYDSLRTSLTNKIPSLTNFTEKSFNFVWTQAFANEVREVELDATAAYLEGFVDYSGGPIDEDDLRRLDIEDATTPEQINDRLNSANLDELVKIVGIDRDPGQEATGEVTFTTQSSDTDIPEGTSVGTTPDSQGNFFEFETTEASGTDAGETSVTVPIEAVEVGAEYNVGANTITHIPDPPPGVQDVVNNEATTGGEGEESNDELRQRAKQAIFTSSGGGTAEGLAGSVETVENVVDVEVEEFFEGDSWHGTYPHGHVIVDGGTDADVFNKIQEARPVSVEHFLVRPDVFSVESVVTLSGQDIDESEVRDRIETYYDSLSIGDDVIYNKIIQAILNADNDINDVETLDLTISNEPNEFDDEELDNFENGDISIENRFWSGWTGDTGNFSTQTTTVLEGSTTAELTAANANVTVTASRSSETQQAFEALVQIDNQTGNSGDDVSYTFDNAGTTLGAIEFQGNGDVVWTGSSTTVGTWSASTEHEIILQFDFRNDQVDVTFDGSASNDLALSNSVSGYDGIDFGNDSTASGSTVNAYTDDISLPTHIYPVGLGDEMVNDGITTVSGTSGGNSVNFTEDTDYREYDISNNSDDDAIQWILSGDRPDTADRSETLTFESGRDTYKIDTAMMTEGIEKVEDGAGNTFVEGTDFEEIDTTNDGSDDGIEWLSGGTKPNDDTEFTVTYLATTTAFIDYDITDADITIALDEKAESGPITLTVL